MRTRNLRILLPIVALLSVGSLFAQNSEQPAYLNTALPPQQRAEDLVRRMTVEEKVTQLVNQARAIPPLKVPAYDWWSEALHGVATNGTTEFPEPIGLAATFDSDAIHRMAIVIGTEGRIKHVQAVRDGHSNIFEGLDFWAPNINIFRDPRWGRGQETYGASWDLRLSKISARAGRGARCILPRSKVLREEIDDKYEILMCYDSVDGVWPRALLCPSTNRSASGGDRSEACDG